MPATRRATDGWFAASDDRVAADRRAGDATPEERAIQEVNTSIYCFRRDLLGPALRRVSARQRPGRVLPDRRHRRAPRRRPRGRRLSRRRRRAGPGRQRPLAAGAGRGRAPPPHQRAWLLEGVTMLDPRHDLHRRDGPARRATSPSSPARSCRARTRRGRWLRDRPGQPARRLRRRRRRGGRAHGGRRERRDRRRARIVGPYAVLAPGAVLRSGTVTGAFYTAPVRRAEADGSAMELVTKKRLPLYSGRTPPRAGRGDRRPPRRRAGRRQPREFANGESHRRFERVVRGTDVFIMQTHSAATAVQRLDHGAADHDRRRATARRPSASPRSAPSTATAARTARPRAASRSPPSSSPTCSRPPGAEAHGQRRPALRARSRASSTARSTTSPPCRCSRTTCGSTRATASSSSRPTPAG